MTLEEINNRIDLIKTEAASGDYEAAHASEDQLRLDFIKYVGTLHIPSLAFRANCVASTEAIEFARYTA